MVLVGYKNVPASIRLAREAEADEIWLLTSSAVEQYEGVDQIFSQVPIHETPAIYRSCDLLLKLSYVEGMFGPPLEMFHCGGTALVYAVTGHDEYIVHRQNSYVADRDDEKAVVGFLRSLRENPEELELLKQGAAQTAAAWPDWQTCSAAFEEALLAISNQRPTCREYLKRYTEELFNTPKPLIQAKAQAAFAEREQAVWLGERTEKDNFVEFYWDGKGQFNEQQSTWQHYSCEEWTTLSFELQVEEIPLWLRLDPSIRIGILEIESIRVRNLSRNTEIMAFQDPDDFQALFLTGDLKWIFPERKNIVFAYGPDPIFHLPAVEAEHAESGDKLAVSIRLKETGVQQFF
ncbi:MAG: glycosyltransferase, partial [Candidatus Electrothrix sp. AR3]|nr:glycosyltransferase [Candidatus Electrothrix sp. AR3]